MLLCGSDLLEPFNKPGVWVPDQVQNLDTFWYRKGMGATSLNQREEVEPEEVLRRITTACGRLVQGTRQARVCGGAWFGCRGRDGAAAWALSPGHWLSDPS